MSLTTRPTVERPLPLTTFLSKEDREELTRSLDENLLTHLGPDRFDAYGSRFKPPAWLAQLPRLPERDDDGRLPSFS